MGRSVWEELKLCQLGLMLCLDRQERGAYYLHRYRENILNVI